MSISDFVLFLFLFLFFFLGLCSCSSFSSDFNLPATISHDERNDVSCWDADDCLANYTQGIEDLYYINSTLVQNPICDQNVCTCNTSCFSKTYSFDTGEPLYYCGPCGRIGSECNSNNTCNEISTACLQGYCQCYKNGKFYEVYFCYIPYYGYEVALQISITICIIIVLGLIVASAYNLIGLRRLRQMHGIRHLFRGQEGVRESPPDDVPPKYEDVMVDLPTYQEAITMSQTNLDNINEGIVNHGFEDENGKSVANEVDVGEDRAMEIAANQNDPPEYIYENKNNNMEVENYVNGNNLNNAIDTSVINTNNDVGVNQTDNIEKDKIDENRIKIAFENELRLEQEAEFKEIPSDDISVIKKVCDITTKNQEKNDLANDRTPDRTNSFSERDKIQEESSTSTEDSEQHHKSKFVVDNARRIASARKKIRKTEATSGDENQMKDKQPDAIPQSDIEMSVVIQSKLSKSPSICESKV